MGLHLQMYLNSNIEIHKFNSSLALLTAFTKFKF